MGPTEEQVTEAKHVLQSLSEVAKPVRKLFKCVVCGTTWMRWYIVSKLFGGFPVWKYCSKECRRNRRAVQTISDGAMSGGVCSQSESPVARTE